ncbi:hypothetical protein TURU_108477 [Turdus rufiventris]|nr:hypothetical protein TURU_108477 [Turdus rufiventris]
MNPQTLLAAEEHKPPLFPSEKDQEPTSFPPGTGCATNQILVLTLEKSDFAAFVAGSAVGAPMAVGALARTRSFRFELLTVEGSLLDQCWQHTDSPGILSLYYRVHGPSNAKSILCPLQHHPTFPGITILQHYTSSGVETKVRLSKQAPEQMPMDREMSRTRRSGCNRSFSRKVRFPSSLTAVSIWKFSSLRIAKNSTEKVKMEEKLKNVKYQKQFLIRLPD